MSNQLLGDYMKEYKRSYMVPHIQYAHHLARYSGDVMVKYKRVQHIPCKRHGKLIFKLMKYWHRAVGREFNTGAYKGKRNES